MLTAFGLLSCNRHEKSEKVSIPITRIAIDNIKETEFLKYSDIFESINIVRLETKNESLIGRIDKILYYNDMFFIMDQVQSKGVFVFDATGRFLTRIGRVGKGPGEYDMPNDIAIDPFAGHIMVYNHAGNKMLAYGFDGKFIEETRLRSRFKSFAILNKNVFAIYYDYDQTNKPDQINWNLQIVHKNGEIYKEGFHIDKSTRHSRGSMNFFNIGHNSLLVSPGYSDTIFSITQDSFFPKYFIDYGVQSIPHDFFRAPLEEFTKNLRTSNYAFTYNYFELPYYLAFSFIYKRMVYNCVYSLKTKAIKCANVFVNDLYGLVVGGIFACSKGNMLVSYFDPANIEPIKKIYKSSSTDGAKLKKILLHNLDEMKDAPTDLKALKDIIKTAEFNPTKKEINNILAISPSDNPVLILHKIKPF